MFAVLHLADFSLQAVLRNEPAKANQPAALFAQSTKKSLVLSANARARAAGVELGMTASQAVARCPTLVIRTVQPSAEAEARSTLIALSFTLSPTVEDTAPGICTIDLKGCDPTKLSTQAESAVASLAHLGLPATCGLAASPLLALYAARAASPVLHITDAATFLSPLPLATADPSPELASVLAQWGLRTLGDFTALPAMKSSAVSALPVSRSGIAPTAAPLARSIPSPFRKRSPHPSNSKNPLRPSNRCYLFCAVFSTAFRSNSPRLTTLPSSWR